jgi:protease PrsW
VSTDDQLAFNGLDEEPAARPLSGEPSTAPAPAPQRAAPRPMAPPQPSALGLHPVGTHRILTVGAVVAGVLTLFIIAADLEPWAFASGFALAIVPVPLYVMLALWLDRYEPEPVRTLAQTFAWGATVAVCVAVLANTFVAILVEGLVGPDAAERAALFFSAPVVEELAKGFVLYVFFRELKDEFDGVIDGIVYAAMVGLGFAMVENVQYYGAAIQEGVESGAVTFFLRGVMSPFAHPLFTAMFGIGLGYVRQHHGEPRSWTVPAAGLTLAIVLHSLWNLASTSDVWFLAMYLLVMVPTFLGVLAVIYVSLRREGRVVREHLEPLVEHGVLPREEVERLAVVRSRLAASGRALMTGGIRRWRARREMHRIASELAFHRCRVRRGLTLGPEGDARREEAYLRRLGELYEEIHR